METKNENKINIEKIVQAGKAIKAIFTAVLSLIICFIFGALVATNSTDLETIKNTYALIGIVSLILNLVVLYNLNEAGNNLENVTSFQEGDSNYNSLIEKQNVNTTRSKEFAEGGIIVYVDETNEHGLVCSLDDLGCANWDNAKMLCEAYSEGGFSDWRLPNKDELQLIFTNFHMKGGNFSGNYYWSSTENGTDNAWYQDFTNGSQNHYSKNFTPYIRAVRNF